ncbi:MAG: hypothetical protein M1820_005146 [Bogoriella megaspora]|nr:MAG: hypothetical protein M1820_005146 [Bogoriella megaspora]
MAAMRKGLHILCEKPLSQRVEEAEEVIALAKQMPYLKVMTAYSRRFDASYREAEAKIKKGLIGTPTVVRSQTGDLLDETGFFMAYAKQNGGVFVDCCIHGIDLSLWYFGDVKSKAYWAIGTISHPSHHAGLAESNDDDNALGVLEYWDGRLAHFYCSRTQAHDWHPYDNIFDTEPMPIA